MRRVILFSILVSLVLSVSASAQTYNAKFVCGKPDAEIKAFAFASGLYYTSINVHANTTTDLRKRFSVALMDEKYGDVSDWISETLPAGRSMQIDCGNIYAHLGIPVGTFIDGFVTIVAGPLDVVGVYTVDGNAGAGVSSIHTERVPGS